MERGIKGVRLINNLIPSLIEKGVGRAYNSY
jgi:hypothetical protein